jgi:citrate/tricarballylate utilization protein
MHGTKALAEADRLMIVCNSCRYCEGLCAVFPAMERRRIFTDGDLNYLANLCHACGACYDDCQFSPPHEFNVNVPKTLAQVRADSYQTYAWPRAFSRLFARNGLAIATITALSVAAFLFGFDTYIEKVEVLGLCYNCPRAFYRVMPHGVMVAVFGTAFVFALVAIGMGVRTFWRNIGEPTATLVEPYSLWQAVKDAGRLRYLDGGGAGCTNNGERARDLRKYFHHLTFYGFLLCFLATCIATVYHYLLGWEAPYRWYDAPVVAGTIGGIGLLLGPAGLLLEKWRSDPALRDQPRVGMDVAFLVMLFLTSLTGLALLALRTTEVMELLLALHLGVVFGFFITLPYGKFVHGIYRFAALVRYARESRQPHGSGEQHA